MKLFFAGIVVLANACQNFSYSSDCQPGAADPTCNTNLCNGQFCRGEYQMAYDCSGSTCYSSVYGGFDCDLGLTCIDQVSTGLGYCQRMTAAEKAIYSSIVIGIFAVLIALICVCRYYKKKRDERQRIREQREAELMGEPSLPQSLLNGSNPPASPKSPPIKFSSAKLGLAK